MEEKIINITNEAIENSITTEKENVIFGGSTNYEELTNKPQINNIELIGNKTFEELGIPTKISQLQNDSGFITEEDLFRILPNGDEVAY